MYNFIDKSNNVETDSFSLYFTKCSIAKVTKEKYSGSFFFAYFGIKYCIFKKNSYMLSSPIKSLNFSE